MTTAGAQVDRTEADRTEADGTEADRTAALPLLLEAQGRHAGSVRRWVEGVLGWQPVDAATAVLVPPALRLIDHATVEAGRHAPDALAGVVGTVPTVLLLDDELDVGVAAEATLRAAPDLVVPWPSGRDELAGAVRDLLARRPPVRERTPGMLTVGGAAGGVGTTTVVLAVAGLWAWRGTPTLAVVRGAAPQLPVVDAAALGAHDLWVRAAPLPGVATLRGVRVVGGVAGGVADQDRRPPAVLDARVGAVVLDAGVDADVEVLVCRPDAAALVALATTTAALVVVVGDGPVRPSALRRQLDGRRWLHLPWSARVARAGLQGRVPAGLPGTWLRALAPALASERVPQRTSVQASSQGSGGGRP